MFVRNPHGSETIQALAAQVGVVFGESIERGMPGFINAFGVKDDLKAAGARWDGLNKAWLFDSYQAAEAALRSIIN
jgi:hypothetical protein